MMSVAKLIKEHLPNFCFQTAFEVTTMLEIAQDSETLLPNHVGAVLCKFVRDGHVERRRVLRAPLHRQRCGYKSRVEYRWI